MVCSLAGQSCSEYVGDESQGRKQETPPTLVLLVPVNDIARVQSTEATKWAVFPTRTWALHAVPGCYSKLIYSMRILKHLLTVVFASLVAARSAQHVGKVLPETAGKVKRFPAAQEAYRGVEKRTSQYLNANTTSLLIRSIPKTPERLIYS